ncbi:MAG: hypothetical protein IKR23_03305 [Lachnospiraceae bacterium]|nr:hypothetical protein [Lachnospiraceae bacterium]
MWTDEENGYIEPGQPLDEEPGGEADKPAEDKAKKRLISIAVPVILTLVFFIIPLFWGTPVYALNDDIQIRDILSGAYSGSPDLHTVYMGAVLSGILALLYTVIPFIPWYGLFLCAAPAAVFFIVCLVIMRSDKALLIRSLLITMMSGLCLWFLYPAYIMPHYTLVAAMFAAAALFLMMNRQYMGGVIMLLICQQVRQQVFLMILPFAAAVLLLCFIEDKDKHRELKKPLLIFAGTLACLLVFNLIAYAGSSWQDYLKLNDARTQLYDYTGVWTSSAAADHYAGYGVSGEELEFYRQYDLLPIEGAGTGTLYGMAAYREEGRHLQGMEHLKAVVYDLAALFLHDRGKAQVYAWGLLLLYVQAVIVALHRGKGWGVLFGAGCFLMHIMIYAYLLWRGRVPDRVTVSLCMAQCFMLGGMVVRYSDEIRRIYWLIQAAILTIVLSQVLNAAENIRNTYNEQIAVNNEDDVLYSYMAQNAGRLYVLETYATVYHTAYVTDTDRAGNTVIMGGWQYLSPLQDKKLKAYAYDSRFELFSKGGAELVFRTGDGLSAGDMDSYLNRIYGTGLRLVKELPGNFEIYVVE